MDELEIRPYAPADRDQVIQLWRDCSLVVPANDPDRDIARKLAFQPELFLVGIVDGRVTASVMAGYDGHRGWINYLAVSPARRKEGFGRRMMAEAEARLCTLGCLKINLQVRRSNAKVIEFYRKLGFVEDDVICMGKRLTS
jgi:ribosomal protein S18 acetylase RimI-like enzyme